MPKILGGRFAIAILIASFLFAAYQLPAVASSTDPVEYEELADLGPTQDADEETLVAQSADDDVNDPLEPVNRVIFQFNEFFYDIFLRPISRFYNEWMPTPVRDSVHNFLENLKTPVILANDLLQFEGHRAFVTASRVVINTTVGVAGFMDVAKELGFERHKEDFGQTLGVWGWGEGPYLVLPILGPSNPRDAVGKYVVDSFFDPLDMWLNNVDREEWVWVRAVIDGIDQFARITDELDQVKKTSIDFYAAIRSLYRQKRRAEISNGREIQLPPIPDLGYDLEQPSEAPALGSTSPAPAAGSSQQSSSWDAKVRPAAVETAERIRLPAQPLKNPTAPHFQPATGNSR